MIEWCLQARSTRNAIVAAVRCALCARGLPDDIIFAILGSDAYAANIIRRAALCMLTPRRDIRMSIRWFRMSAGLRDPVFVCNHGWHWVDEMVFRMPIDEEFSIREVWENAGRPVPSYVFRPVSVCMVVASRKRHVHYSELHALRHATKRVKRKLPHRWVSS
jgi:hypothetical protein